MNELLYNNYLLNSYSMPEQHNVMLLRNKVGTKAHREL